MKTCDDCGKTRCTECTYFDTFEMLCEDCMSDSDEECSSDKYFSSSDEESNGGSGSK